MAAKKAATAGYSGTPLAKKLGIVEGSHVQVLKAPADLRAWLAPIPAGVVFDKALSEKTDVVHIFATERAVLAKHLESLRGRIRKDAAIWVSWPKKSSHLYTNITQDLVRDSAFKNGLVDIKVCAVSEQWSGLKLVVPLNKR